MQHADYFLINNCLAVVLKWETDLKMNGKYLTPTTDELYNNFQLNVMNSMKFNDENDVFVQQFSVMVQTVGLTDIRCVELYAFLKKIINGSYKVDSPRAIGNSEIGRLCIEINHHIVNFSYISICFTGCFMYMGSITIAYIIGKYFKSRDPGDLPTDLAEQIKGLLTYHNAHFTNCFDADFWVKLRMCQSLLILLNACRLDEETPALLRPCVVPISDSQLQVIFRVAADCLQGKYRQRHF